MRTKLYREHKYVSFALNEMASLMAKTDFGNDAAFEHLQDEWQGLKEMLTAHAHHEEENFHSLLKRKGSTVHLEVHHEHAYQEKMLEHLQHRLDSIKTNPDRVEAGYQLYLIFRKFVGDILLHFHEEETTILPELQRLYTDEELRAIEHPTYLMMTTDDLLEMVQTLFPHMNFSDKCAFLLEIKFAQPEKFAKLWGKAHQFIDAEDIKRIRSICSKNK